MYLTILLLLIYIGVAFYAARPITKEFRTDNFLSKEQTSILKGLCCIVVIFVHIPSEYANRVQDLVGGFAYIAVTLYFLFSAYGLRYSFENKKNYGNNFIKNRVIVLLVPFFAVVLIKWIFGFNPFIGGLKFIFVLLVFYVLTFIAHKWSAWGGTSSISVCCSIV